MKRLSVAELIAILRDLGVEQGSVMLCHSYLPALGQFERGVHGVVDALQTAVGPSGTLVAPTFTYSFFNGTAYDPARSRSAVGVLGDAIAARGRRSLDPNFSHAAIGPYAGELLKWDGEPSIGPNSFYERFLKCDGCILLLGVDFRALPLFMHLEATLRLPYRYPKKFGGTLVDAGQKRPAIAIHYVRDEKTDPQCDRTRIGAQIESRADCHIADLPYGRITHARASAVVDEVRKALNVDPLILLDERKPFAGEARP